MDNLDFALIGKQIKEVRTDRQLTQEYLAKVTDVNVSHISNIRTNKGQGIFDTSGFYLQCYGMLPLIIFSAMNTELLLLLLKQNCSAYC